MKCDKAMADITIESTVCEMPQMKYSDNEETKQEKNNKNSAKEIEKCDENEYETPEKRDYDDIKNISNSSSTEIKENLDRYSECKKMETVILTNLLKNFETTQSFSSESDSDAGNSYKTGSSEEVDFKSLIEAMSSCDVNKNKETVEKDDTTNDKCGTKDGTTNDKCGTKDGTTNDKCGTKDGTTNDKCGTKDGTTNDKCGTKANFKDNSCVISDIQSIFEKKDVKKTDMKSGEGKKISKERDIKKRESIENNHKSERRKDSSKHSSSKNDYVDKQKGGYDNLEKLESVAIMERLTAKISSMHMTKKDKMSRNKTDVKKEKSVSKEYSDSTKADSKTSDYSTGEYISSSIKDGEKDRTRHKKTKQKTTVLLERGPWTKPKKFGVRNNTPYVQTNNQLVNHNFLSGGEFWTAEDPIELIPQTITQYDEHSPKLIESYSPHIENLQHIIEKSVYDETKDLNSSLSASAIAQELEKEVFLLSNGIVNENRPDEIFDVPNWADLDIVENIMEREARCSDSDKQDVTQLPTIIIDGPGDANSSYDENAFTIASEQEIMNEIIEKCTSRNTNTSVHAVPYGYQRIDQQTAVQDLQDVPSLTYLEQDPSGYGVDFAKQSLVIPTVAIDLDSPIPIYSPVEQTMSLQTTWNTSNSCVSSPTNSGVTNFSPDMQCNDFNYERIDSFPSESSYSSINSLTLNQDFSTVNSSLMNQSYDPCATLSVDLGSPNQAYSPQDQMSKLRVPRDSQSNRSSFSYSNNSPEQCYSSPNIERIENTNYDNLYEMSSPLQQRNARGSFSSISPLESPELYLGPDDFERVSKALSAQLDEFDSKASESILEDGNVLKDFDLFPQMTTADQNIPDSVFNSRINGSLSYELDDRVNFRSQKTNETQGSGSKEILVSNYSVTTGIGVQKLDTVLQRSAKGTKLKPVPIAAKPSYPCCVKINKSAKDSLEEMFERLDEKMQRNICMKVHSFDDDHLSKLLDWLLSGWGESAKLQMPRLPLLYTICERMLMTHNTMVKFFKTYGNGHTVLDRAILTCPQTPILSRYIAECSIKALKALPKDRDYVIDKSDSLGNGVLHRGAYCGVACVESLGGILQLNSDGTIINVNKLNADGYSPLHLACTIHVQQPGGLLCSCLIMTHMLLEHGKADPNIKDGKSGKTSLHKAVDSNACAPGLVSLLLKYGADPSIRNYSSSTPLDLAKSACRSTQNLQYAKQVVDILKKLKRPY